MSTNTLSDGRHATALHGAPSGVEIHHRGAAQQGDQEDAAAPPPGQSLIAAGATLPRATPPDAGNHPGWCAPALTQAS